MKTLNHRIPPTGGEFRNIKFGGIDQLTGRFEEISVFSGLKYDGINSLFTVISFGSIHGIYLQPFQESPYYALPARDGNILDWRCQDRDSSRYMEQ